MGHIFSANVNCFFNPFLFNSISQLCIFRVLQVMKSLHDPREVGNNLVGINDNVTARGLEQKKLLDTDGSPG